MSERLEELERLEAELEAEDRELLDSLARGLAKRRLGSAAVFFLESMKPLGWIGSQVLYFFQPIMRIVFTDAGRYDRAARLLERRGVIELLLRRVEDHQALFAEEEQAEKRARKEAKAADKAARKLARAGRKAPPGDQPSA